MRTRWMVTGVAALAVFVAFFGFLAADLAWRVWDTRGAFESRADVALLIGLETTRALATLTVAGIAVRVAWRGGAGAGALACSLLFGALWYAKATTFGFPGYAQERLALALMDAGVPRALLMRVFGQPAWALAPAATAMLLFALRYPAAPDAASVRDVHDRGRRGMLRGVALAGTDIRSLLHRAAAAVLESGALRTPVVVAAGGAATVALAFGGPAWRWAATAALAAAAALAFAFLRTAWVLNAGEPRTRIGRLAASSGAAFVGIAAAAMLGFVPGAVTAQVALVVSAAAPLVAAFLLAGLSAPPPRPAGPA